MSPKKWNIYKNKINVPFKINMNFQRRTLLRVTLVFVKESWDIKISLNTMRSTQVFNKILYKNSYFILKRCLIKMPKINNNKNEFLDYMWKFPTMDSYCVTLVPGRKSWGMIIRIKCLDSIQSV